MQNPFDSIEEPKRVMPNPGFMCQQYIETHSHLEKFWPKVLCTKQCDKCINEVIEHHRDK